MARKPVKEAGTALIFATVLFVLSTIAFGVLWYMEFAERDKNKAEVESKQKDVTAARGEVADAKLESLITRVYFGVDSEDDRKTVNSWGDKEKTKAGEMIKKMKQTLIEKIAGGDESKLPPELTNNADESKFPLWDVDDKGVPNNLPEKSPLAIIGEVNTARETALANEAKTVALYTSAVADIKKAITDYDAVKLSFKNITDALPKDFETKLKALADKFEARKDQFTAAEKASRDEINRIEDEKGKLDRDKTILARQIGTLQEQVAAQAARLAKSNETFQFDEPQGKIIRRLPEGVVEINLGSADLVRTGLTFTVLPNDFPEKGRQSRIRVIRLPDDRGIYKNVERFIEKATIEVVEVVGPHLSRCRISQEYDPIRDGAAPGDLLYNGVWRKGTADHIALVGVFDINGDGTDDIEAVIRDLTRMGIPIDAYYNMKTRKWVGQLTEQTRYIVEGIYPIQGALDPNRDAKTKLLGDISAAVKFAREKGISTVKFQDFFPRMGYRVKIDVPEDKINQATAPYLVPVGEVPMNPGN